MGSVNDKVTITIRSAGERTEQLCQKLIMEQGISENNISIIRLAPFSAAMRKSFAIGIERGLPWTLCNDADVLLRPNAVEQMMQLAEQQAENVCEIQGYILDKFFGGPRHGGIHLYRTSLLPQVLANIPEEGINIQPEYFTLKAMKAQGYPYTIVPYLVGIHGFEQYYKDIFRTCFVHARKHHYLIDLFLTFWRDKAHEDRDYSVALQGLSRCIAYSGEVFIDVQQEIYHHNFAALKVEEKEPILLAHHSLSTIESLITSWQKPEPYQKHYPTEMGLIELPVTEPITRQEKLTRRLNELGFIRTAIYTFGWVLARVGNRLQTIGRT